jgi:hypothetical protein
MKIMMMVMREKVDRLSTTRRHGVLHGKERTRLLHVCHATPRHTNDHGPPSRQTRVTECGTNVPVDPEQTTNYFVFGFLTWKHNCAPT